MKALERWILELNKHKKEILFAFFFFFITIMTFFYMGRFVDQRPRVVSLPDLILDRIPPMLWAGHLFVWGIIFFFIALLAYPLFFEVKLFARTLEQFSLLVMIRNAFLPLTGLGGRADAIAVQFPWPLDFWNFQNDLFFSGHTLIPLLGFFLFKGKNIRYFFLGGSILMGLASLFTHLHYSIDVFAGFFIGYGSYKLGEWIFGKIR